MREEVKVRPSQPLLFRPAEPLAQNLVHIDVPTIAILHEGDGRAVINERPRPRLHFAAPALRSAAAGRSSQRQSSVAKIMLKMSGHFAGHDLQRVHLLTRERSRDVIENDERSERMPRQRQRKFGTGMQALVDRRRRFMGLANDCV